MVTNEEIEVANKYFSKIDGVRMGKFMSELKYQYIMRLHDFGLSPMQIKRIIKISHDKQHYYRTTYTSDTRCSEEIKEKMLDWIKEGKYPMSNYGSPGNKIIGYILTDNPKQKLVRTSKALYRSNIEFDRLLDQLGL
jgi:Zn/Cd-binding protein ZinT